jgi:hypothetical protein
MPRLLLYFALIVVPALPSLLAQNAPDPRQIVQESIEKDRFNFNRARDYTYVQRVETRDLDASGRITKTESSSFDVNLIAGRPYRKLIAENDKSLSPSKARKAQEGFDKVVGERAQESEREQKKRRAEEERRRQETRAFLREIPEAFTFSLIGEETIEGLPAWVIDAKPKPGYRGRSKNWELLTKFQGRIWIDRADHQWVRVEAQTIATVSFGWVLARLQPGAQLTFRQARINSEIWLPVRATTKLDARLAIFKKIRSEVEVVWKDYRKFQTDSRVVSAEELSPSEP